MPTTMLRCMVQIEFPSGGSGECGGEINVEWEQVQGPSRKTDRRFCQYCEMLENAAIDPKCETFEGDERPEHSFIDEWEEGDWELELVSYTTYCWHPLTKEKALEQLKDEWAAGEEKAYEARMGL